MVDDFADAVGVAREVPKVGEADEEVRYEFGSAGDEFSGQRRE